MADTGTRTYALEQVGSTMIVQVYVDGFEELTLLEKTTAYYLYRAAIAGRDITYDQHHKDALAIRNILEGIVTNNEGIDRTVYAKILEYTKMIWINNGMYNDRTREKFVPDVDFETFTDAAKTAQSNGADLGLNPGERIEDKLQSLR
ncbi:peptidase M49, partial [candidate division KSB1 bacterium]|nr:peptidase M49 [candidate division KSB1 bacterium]